MTIYAHVPTKGDLPDQTGYWLELLRIEPDPVTAAVTPMEVTLLRYLVAGDLFMSFRRIIGEKQGAWAADYVGSPENALKLMDETVTKDTAVGGLHHVQYVTELTFGLTETDLVQISERQKKGIDGRWLAPHWIRHHLGVPTVTPDGDVVFEGGVD